MFIEPMSNKINRSVGSGMSPVTMPLLKELILLTLLPIYKH